MLTCWTRCCRYNPYSWTKLSNVLMFESPPGVGFSYCDECIGNATCMCEADDMSTASDNYDAVVAFLDRFPEIKKNPFYITGESYAGMYIPTLMDQIRQHPGTVNLIGAAIAGGHTFSSKVRSSPPLFCS